MEQFDPTLLPPNVQKIVKLAVTKTPSFSNIAATAVSTFVLASLFGQLRCTIDDPVYSEDSLGLNSYSILLSRSGSGKDRTYQSLLKTCKPAFDFITKLQLQELEEQAKARYIRIMSKDNSDFDETSVTKEDYKDLIEPPESPFVTLGSSRGGITTSLNRMAKHQYGAKSIFSSELAMAMQSSPFVMENMELLSALYDMGSVAHNEYKTKDSKEDPVDNMYMSFLGISSPAPFYNADSPVNKLLVPLFKTALARRSVVVFSNAREEFENDIVPESRAHKRQIQLEQRILSKELNDELSEKLLSATKQAAENPSVMMDTEASEIYDDYKGYTETLGKRYLLDDGDSVEGIQLLGLAFKMLRIAGIWALTEGKSIITKDIIVAAIYYVDHGTVHLTRFMATLNMKPYELFVADWQQGFFSGDRISIDRAITRGYITAKHVSKQALTSFLTPVNSKLQGRATVTFNESTNEFMFKVVAPPDPSKLFSYRAVRGHIDESRPLNGRSKDKSFVSIANLMKVSSTFNPFDGDTTKFICIQSTNSPLMVDQVHAYFANVKHHIVPTNEEQTSYLLVLPVNTPVSKAEYKYVCLSISVDLLCKALPELHEPSTYLYGSDLYEVKSNLEGDVFDVSGILGNFAAGADIEQMYTPPTTKLTKVQVDKYIATEVLEHKDTVVAILNTSATPLLFLVGLVYDMKQHNVSNEQIKDIVDNLNSSLETSIKEIELQDLVYNPLHIV